MLRNFQSFINTPLVAALVDKSIHPGSEDLKQAFAAADEMVRLLGKVHDYMQKKGSSG